MRFCLSSLRINLRWNFFPAIFVSILLPLVNVHGVGASLLYKNEPPAQGLKKVEANLKKLNSGYNKDNDTEGFDYHLTNSFFSPFTFDIYIGPFNKNNTIVRIDAPDRMGYALADAFAQENGDKSFTKVYPKKWVIFGDLLTLISPGFGHMYSSMNSPFTAPDSFLTSLMYLGIDGILLWVGGKTFFTHGFDPFDRGIIATSIMMGSYRLYYLGKFHMRMVAQNRLVELGYKFRF